MTSTAVKVRIAGPQGPGGAASTVPGPAGTSVLAGNGAPSGSLGNNGDVYVDKAGAMVYGPKAAGSWGAGTSIRGLTGNNFLSGTGAPSNSLGNDGDSYFDKASGAFYGPKAAGAWPAATSLKGQANGYAGLNAAAHLPAAQNTEGLSPLTAALLFG